MQRRNRGQDHLAGGISAFVLLVIIGSVFVFSDVDCGDAGSIGSPAHVSPAGTLYRPCADAEMSKGCFQCGDGFANRYCCTKTPGLCLSKPSVQCVFTSCNDGNGKCDSSTLCDTKGLRLCTAQEGCNCNPGEFCCPRDKTCWELNRDPGGCQQTSCYENDVCDWNTMCMIPKR